MQRPEQHQIDSQAENILRRLLPSNWVCSNIDPDYGIDHIIEPCDGANLTGLAIEVQLKGRKKIKGIGAVKYPLETKHLAYYLGRRQAVFLVIIDVQREIGYWMFTQQYALENLAGKDWRRQATMTISIPPTQLISDTLLFRKAMEDADKFMANLRPGGLMAALKLDKAKWESLDPRFEVVVTATEHGPKYEFRAREIVEFTLTFKGDAERREEFNMNFFGKGLAVPIVPSEIEITGSALIAEAFKNAAAVQHSRHIMVDLTMVANNDEGRPVQTLTLPPTRLEGGYEEFRVKGSLPNSILSLEGSRKSNEPFRLSVQYRLKGWAGQPLRQLAYFDQMNSLLGHLADGHAGTFVCSFMGYELLSGGLNKLGPKRWKGIAAALCTLHRARELAKRLNINPIFPVDVTWDDLDAIDGLCDLMDFGARPATQAKFTTVHERRLVASAFLADDAQMTNGLLRFVRSASDFNLFGIVIAVPAILIQLTHAKASCPDGDLSIELADLTNPDITIEWTGTDQSVLSFQPDKADDVPVRLT